MGRLFSDGWSGKTSLRKGYVSRNLRCVGEKLGETGEQHSSQREQPAELPRGSIMLAFGFKEHQGGQCSHTVYFLICLHLVRMTTWKEDHIPTPFF